MNEEKYRLCYVDQNILCFTDDIKTQWGDDWNDAPASCNAGFPYEDDKHHVRYIGFINEFMETAVMEYYSVEDIIRYKMAIYTVGKDEIKAGMTMKKVMQILDKNHCYYGEIIKHGE